MRIQLKFSAKNNKLPLDYRRVFLSYFKYSLSQIANGKYYEKYYFPKNRRPFTFALRLPKADFSCDGITLDENEFTLTFSTGDSMAGFVFMSAFIAQKGKSFRAPFENAYLLQSVVQLPERTVTSDTAIVKMLSPLCLRDHDKENNRDIYYSSASENFPEHASRILAQQLIADGFSEDMACSVRIVPVKCKKTVVKHYNCSIECTLGEFAINADKGVINFLLQFCIGSRKSAGFGLAELVAEGN